MRSREWLLVALASYAAVAPFSAHSMAMNVTILLEAATAAVLLMALWRRES